MNGPYSFANLIRKLDVTSRRRNVTSRGTKLKRTPQSVIYDERKIDYPLERIRRKKIRAEGVDCGFQLNDR
jgi:hypothetical protein